jgi:hypothetical protein
LLSSGRPWNPQSWNRYAYTLNNPLRYTDPVGLFEWDESLGGNVTDKELRKRAGKDKDARARAQSIINERKAIRKQLKRLNGSSDASLEAVGNAIGGEGKANGVTISMGAVTPGAAAEVETTHPLTLDANGNPLANLTVQPGAQGDSLFVGLAHEGTHIWDAQSVAKGDRLFVTHFETELSAYLETIVAAKSLSWSSVGPRGGTPFWSSSWSNVDQQTRPAKEIVNFLFTSPLYKEKNAAVAYTK